MSYNNDSSGGVIGIVFLLILLVLYLVLAPVACTAPSSAKKALTAAGYSNIKTTGYEYFSCDEKDAFHTGFTAVGPTGIPVKGVVCEGWFKGATIRLEN